MNKVFLKVMLVDDEDNVRNLLRTCIDWKELGFEVAGEASSGSEALDMLEDTSPDVIITDIRMPYMDGLEFAGIVAQRYPHIKVVFLSAYDEFEYAQEGIKIGISDFLLKPIKRADLKDAMLTLREKIDEERLSNSEYIRLKERLAENFEYLKDRFMNELLQGSCTDEELMEKLHFFSLEGLSKYAQIALISIDFPDKLKAVKDTDGIDSTAEQRALHDLDSVDIVSDYFSKVSGISIFFDNSHRLVILSSAPQLDIVQACEQIKALLMHRLECEVCIGIGRGYSEHNGIRRTYKEACEALNYKVVYGKNQVVRFSDIGINKESTEDKSDEIYEIGFYIKAGIQDRAVEIIEGIFDNLYTAKYNNVEQIQVLAVHIVTQILNAIAQLGMNIEDMVEKENLPYHYVLKIDTIPEMKEYLTNVAMRATETVKSARNKKTGRVLNDIIEYINENISKPDLSLTKVANGFFMNASYLSRVFKQEMGQTFVEYLTKARMELAIKLLLETDLLVYEVAEKTGIPDPNYFGKCFKRYTGMSVNDYKKSNT